MVAAVVVVMMMVVLQASRRSVLCRWWCCVWQWHWLGVLLFLFLSGVWPQALGDDACSSSCGCGWLVGQVRGDLKLALALLLSCCELVRCSDRKMDDSDY